MSDFTSTEQSGGPKILNDEKKPHPNEPYVDLIYKKDGNVKEIDRLPDGSDLGKRVGENVYLEPKAGSEIKSTPDTDKFELIDGVATKIDAFDTSKLPPKSAEQAKGIKDRITSFRKTTTKYFGNAMNGLVDSGRSGIDSMKNMIEQSRRRSENTKESTLNQKNLAKLLEEATKLKQIIEAIDLSATNESTKLRTEANQLVNQAEEKAKPDKGKLQAVYAEMGRLQNQNTELRASLNKSKKNSQATQNIRASLPKSASAATNPAPESSSVIPPEANDEKKGVFGTVWENLRHPKQAKDRRNLESNKKKLAILDGNADYLINKLDVTLLPAYKKADRLNARASAIETNAQNEIGAKEAQLSKVEEEILKLNNYQLELDSLLGKTNKNVQAVNNVRSLWNDGIRPPVPSASVENDQTEVIPVPFDPVGDENKQGATTEQLPAAPEAQGEQSANETQPLTAATSQETQTTPAVDETTSSASVSPGTEPAIDSQDTSISNG